MLSRMSVDSLARAISGWRGSFGGFGPPLVFVTLSVAAYVTMRPRPARRGRLMLTLSRTIGSVYRHFGRSFDACALDAGSNQSYLAEGFTAYSTDRWDTLGFVPGADAQTSALAGRPNSAARRRRIGYSNDFRLLALRRSRCFRWLARAIAIRETCRVCGLCGQTRHDTASPRRQSLSDSNPVHAHVGHRVAARMVRVKGITTNEHGCRGDARAAIEWSQRVRAHARAAAPSSLGNGHCARRKRSRPRSGRWPPTRCPRTRLLVADESRRRDDHPGQVPRTRAGHPDLYARMHRLDERTWRRVIENDIPPPAEVIEMIELLDRKTARPVDGRCPACSSRRWARTRRTCCCSRPLAPRCRGRGGERAGNNVALLRLALLKWVFARLQARMEQRLVAFAPDVVVATQMVPAALVSAPIRVTALAHAAAHRRADRFRRARLLGTTRHRSLLRAAPQPCGRRCPKRTARVSCRRASR